MRLLSKGFGAPIGYASRTSGVVTYSESTVDNDNPIDDCTVFHEDWPIQMKSEHSTYTSGNLGAHYSEHLSLESHSDSVWVTIADFAHNNKIGCISMQPSPYKMVPSSMIKKFNFATDEFL